MFTWLYRIKPSVVHKKLLPTNDHNLITSINDFVIEPNQLRWDPRPISNDDTITFIQGLEQVCGAGDPSLKEGICIYNFIATKSMEDSALCNSDGDFLIVPQEGSLLIKTEMGLLKVDPCEIVVIPRGIKFSVSITAPSRGYVLEIFKGHFQLPDLGVLGANALANPRDFQTPTAYFEDRECSFTVYQKFIGKMFTSQLDYSPFNVVAWHGNYVPYKYDLRKFNCINSVSYDHPDPSIYTVLTCPSDEPGTAVADFVIFPPRWIVMDHTFRPPYFHRNCMSEYMGNIYGTYDAKQGGFVSGGASLHSCMIPHGPDTQTFLKASKEELQPKYFNGGLSFMFESCYLLKVAPQSLSSNTLQGNYSDCWQDLPNLFAAKKEN
jgi:homogentisate 1,2-dioxygenase